MGPAADGAREAEPHGGRRSYFIALACTLALPIEIAVIVWTMLPHSVNAGRCEGDGPKLTGRS